MWAAILPLRKSARMHVRVYINNLGGFDDVDQTIKKQATSPTFPGMEKALPLPTFTIICCCAPCPSARNTRSRSCGHSETGTANSRRLLGATRGLAILTLMMMNGFENHDSALLHLDDGDALTRTSFYVYKAFEERPIFAFVYAGHVQDERELNTCWEIPVEVVSARSYKAQLSYA